MHLLVGLGNPGRQYAQTRHNIGFMVVDALAARHNAQFTPGPGEFWQAPATFGSLAVVLVKPTTYMNNSGLAVLAAAEQFGVPPDAVVIIYDDFHLPLGRVRIRPSGSDGGHRGLHSVIYHLGTDQVSRLRCGIGPETFPPGEASSGPGWEAREEVIDFVLSVFEDREQAALGQLIHRAADAAETIVAEGLVPAMNRFNARER